MRRVVVPLLLLVAGLATAVALTEVGYRVARRWVCLGAYSTPYLPHPVYGWQHPPHGRHRIQGCTGRQFEFVVQSRFNAHGLRDGEHAYARPAHGRRVLLLGDSITEALQVPLEETFAALLERGLGANGVPVEIINGAIAGFGTDSALLFFREEGRRYKPDLVLLVFNVANDITENSPALHRALYARDAAAPPAKPYFRLGGDGALVPDDRLLREEHARSTVWRTVERNVYLVRLVRRTLAARPAASTVDDDPFLPYLGMYLSPLPPAWEAAWTVTRALVRQLDTEVQAAGGRLAVAIVPTKEEVRATPGTARVPRMRGGHWDYDQPARTLTALLEEADIPYVFLRGALRVHWGATGTTGFYQADPHLDADGHRVVADALRPFLAAQLAASGAPAGSD